MSRVAGELGFTAMALEFALRALVETGLSVDEQLDCLVVVNGVVRSVARLEADLAHVQAAAGSSAEESAERYGVLLARFADPERHPTLTALLAGSTFDQPDAEVDPEFGLSRVLDGIGVLIDRRRSP